MNEELTVPFSERMVPVPTGSHYDQSRDFLDDVLFLFTRDETHQVLNVELNDFDLEAEAQGTDEMVENLNKLGLSLKNFLLEMREPPEDHDDPAYTPPMLISFLVTEEGLAAGEAVGISVTSLAPDEDWFVGTMNEDISYRGNFPEELMTRLRAHIGEERESSSFKFFADEEESQVSDAVDEGASLTD